MFVGFPKTLRHMAHSALPWTRVQVIKLHIEDVHVVDHGIWGFIRQRTLCELRQEERNLLSNHVEGVSLVTRMRERHDDLIYVGPYKRNHYVGQAAVTVQD